jgi:hypothetical protein
MDTEGGGLEGGTNGEEEEIFSVRSRLLAVVDVEADVEAAGVGY